MAYDGEHSSVHLLTSLREQTREAHARTEAVSGLAKPNLDRATYGKALLAFWSAHQTVDRWLAGADTALPRDESRLVRLREDLKHLGRSPADAPAAEFDAPPPGRPAALGVQYVIEGSALGGRAMLPRLEALGLSAEKGASFFAGLKADPLARWREIVKHLDVSMSHTETRQAGDAAVATFACFQHAFVHVHAGPERRDKA